MTQKPCAFCGYATDPETKLSGAIICVECLIIEVNTYQELNKDHDLSKALAMTPKEVA